MVFCLACVTTSMAEFYRADYDIAAGKEGYSPSTIYHKSAGGYSATYHLESYSISSTLPLIKRIERDYLFQNSRSSEILMF